MWKCITSYNVNKVISKLQANPATQLSIRHLLQESNLLTSSRVLKRDRYGQELATGQLRHKTTTYWVLTCRTGRPNVSHCQQQTITQTIMLHLPMKWLLGSLDYEQPLSFLSWSSETREMHKWPRKWPKTRDGGLPPSFVESLDASARVQSPH